MPSKLYLGLQSPDSVGSHTIVVAEGFEQAIEQVFPMLPIYGPEEQRASHMFHTVDGRRMMIQTGNVYAVEADPEED